MSTQPQVFYLGQPQDPSAVAVYVWRPQGEVKAVVQIVHGMREHMGRYQNFAEFLISQGYAVCGHDHIGHGKSVKEQQPFGYFGQQDGCRRLLRDCRKVTQWLAQEWPEKRVFLMGHSFGSFLTRLYILHCPVELAGYICMGTGGEKKVVPMGRVLAQLLVQISGGEREGRLLDKLSFGSYNSRFLEDDDSMAWLSRDQEVVRQYGEDPYTQALFTNSGFRDLYEIQLAATGKPWAGKVDKQLPILLIAGEEDPVGDYGKGVVQVYERLKMAGVQDVQCKLYEGARHEVLHEINREEVYYDLFRWMEQRRAPNPSHKKAKPQE